MLLVTEAAAVDIAAVDPSLSFFTEEKKTQLVLIHAEHFKPNNNNMNLGTSHDSQY